MIADNIRNLLPKQYKNRKEKLKALYVFEDSEVKSRLFLTQIIAYGIGILLLFNTLAFVIQLTTVKGGESTVESVVDRPDYGQKSKKKSYKIVVENEEQYLEDELSYQVTPRLYTKETFDQALEKAKAYLNQQVLGENPAANQITSSLHLVKSIKELGMKINWIRDEEGLVKYDGSIANKTMTEEKTVTLTAVIKSGDFKEEYDMTFTIKPYQLNNQEELLHKITTAVKEVDAATSSENKFSLPGTVDGYHVYFLSEKKQKYITVLLFGALLAILIPFFLDRKLTQRLEQREYELRMDYPEVVNKLVLLLEAGMTVSRAWTKIVEDYEAEVLKNKRKRRYVYEEMVASYYELKNGLSESQVYDNFGRRVKLTPYMKLSSLLAQNTTKGVEGILSFMKGESIEAFAERKELAKRLGEKAGTKMLLPMGLMLGIVLVIIVIPAFTLL